MTDKISNNVAINEHKRDLITTGIVCGTYIGAMFSGSEFGYLYVSLFMVHTMFFYMSMKGDMLFKLDTLAKVVPILIVGFLCTNAIRGQYHQGIGMSEAIEKHMVEWILLGVVPAFILKVVHNIMVKKADAGRHID